MDCPRKLMVLCIVTTTLLLNGWSARDIGSLPFDACYWPLRDHFVWYGLYMLLYSAPLWCVFMATCTGRGILLASL